MQAKPYSERQKWMFIGAAFQSNHPSCEDCSYHYSSVSHEPYGEGWAARSCDYCGLTESVAGSPDCCPALAQHLAEEAEEA